MGASYRKQKEREKIIFNLKINGHTCIKIINTYPIQFTWCEYDRCRSNMRIKQYL